MGASIDFRAEAHRAADLGSGKDAAGFDVPLHRVFKKVTLRVVLGSVTDFELPGAKDMENLVGAAEIRLRFDEIDAEIREGAALGLENARRARIDRKTA